MANLITVRLQRGEGQPWGFRLQGGKDFSSPLVLQRVNGGSVADQAGLMPGDALVKVNNTEVFNLRHKDAQDVIVGAGNSFELTVSRGAAWRPSVTPTGSLPSPSPVLSGNITPVTKTSLAATPQPVQHIGSAHNQAAKPFPAAAAPAAQINGNDGQIKSIVNKQYNTPVAMYSDETIAETLSSQAEVLAGGVLGVNFKKNERVYSPANSEVYKMLHEHGNDPEPGHQQQQQQTQQVQQQHQHQQQQQQQQSSNTTVTRHVAAPVDKPPAATNGLPAGQNICHSCERLIVGVFVRIKDKNLHADCFKCATCGTSLKNQGYFNLNNKLYCDIHARLAALQSPPPGTNGMVPVTITKPGQKSGVQAISAALNAHATLNGRSQSPYVANNQNNITPKPFGTPMAQVQPPASYPPVAGSVPTPFSAAITGQAPAAAPAPAPYMAPAAQHASYPPVVAPAPAPAAVAPAVAAPVAAAPAAMPTPQGGAEDDEDEQQDQEETDEQVQKSAESPVPPFSWPPKRIEIESVPTATPLYVPPPETQHVVVKEPIIAPPPAPAEKAKEKSKSPPEVKEAPIVIWNSQSKSAPELSRRQSDAVQEQQHQREEECTEMYTTTTTSTSASSEEYRMYTTQTSQPIVTYYDTPLVEMDNPFSSGQRSARASTGAMSDASYTHFVFRDPPLEESIEPSVEPSMEPEPEPLPQPLEKFGHEIPSQMEGMPVPSGRISMTDALVTAPERPYTPFSEVRFERSEMYQELLKEQPSIQVDPEQNFSAFASVAGNRTPVPFKPIVPEIREEPCEPEPEPEPEPVAPEPVASVAEEEQPAKPKEKTPPYPRKDAGAGHYSLAPNRDRNSPMHHPAEIPTYQRKWFNLPTQNPPRTPEPEELRQNVPLAFVDTHSKPHLAKPIAQSVNIRDQVTLKKTQPFTTIQNRTIPVIQTPLEDDAELSHYNNAHARLQSKGVIDRGQSFTPSLILTKHPTTIPYYQHQLGFEEYFAEVKEFDGHRTPRPVSKSPAFGPPPNPLKAFVPPSREGIPVESGLYLSMGKLHGVPWYSNKDHIPADIQQKMLQQQHGLGGGYDTMRQQRNVSYQEKPMTVQTEQRGDMTVQTRSQESAKREQASSERTINSASQVGNALIQKRTRIVEEEEHSQTAKMVEISKFSSKIKDEEAPQKGFVAQQTRRFSGQDEALNVPPQLQQQSQPPEVGPPVQEQQQPILEPPPQVTQQAFPQPPSQQPAPISFPSVRLFPDPSADRFPTKSARKASLMVSGSRQSPTPTSTATGFKAQFNEFLVGAGPLPPLEPQKEESTQELIQSWPPQLPSCMSNTNSCAGTQQCSVKPSLPPVPAPTAPVVTNGRRSSTNSTTTGFSNLLLSCSQNNNHSDRSGAGIGSTLLNKGRAACSTTAPTRGRGVMNKAVAPGGRVPLCGCCNQQIRGPFITALGRIWCPDHFICHNGNCKRPLADIGFVEEKGDLYCEYCFEEFLAPVCSKCSTRVKGDCLNAIGKQFHPECFKCTYCGKLFGNSPFFLEEGDPYCETDWNELFTTKCFACGFPVEAGDKWVEALNNNYHSQCFNCTSCKKNLEGQSFFAKGGRPFCKNHAR